MLFVVDCKQSMIRPHNCDAELPFKPPSNSATSFAPKSTAR
jgi:hypothetical protein